MRSVEAATRDDAIAAAREQFGPSARVVGVRRVRSGGVLGFFATERYVAEVAPDLTNRLAVPPTARQDDAPADFSSPLASAAPARARAAAPARNGAAAWAAEAARTADSPAPARSSAPSWQAAPAKPPAEEERVSELASLLAAPQHDADAPTYGRPTFPRAAAARTPAYPAVPLGEDAVAPAGRDADRRVIPADVPDAPSPFTAALARMVAGDREVRQAVEDALVRPGATRAGTEPRAVRPEPSEESAVPPSPAPQEEEPVGDQVIAPSSSPSRTAEVPTPTWVTEPDVAAPAVSSREEAIAEVLRSALAQGHSDEALAGILRKVLDGASPQSALSGYVAPSVVVEDAGPAAPAPVLPLAEPADVVPTGSFESATASAPALEVVVPEVVLPEPAPVDDAPDYEVPAFEVPAFEVPAFEPVFEAAAFDTPAYDLPVHEAPVPGAMMFEVPVFETRAATPDVRPVDPFAPAVPPAPAWVLSPATSMWGPPSMSATLWGEPLTPVAAYTPIWADVTAPDTVEPSLFEERAESAVPKVAADEPDVEDVVGEDLQVDEAIAEDTLVEEPVAEEVEPPLARTASDPAPMMSFDSTSIMPPLSLLPPLPGSRGRGRPPVPPAPSRRSSAGAVAPTTPAAEPPAPQTEVAAPVSPRDVWAPVAEQADGSLATVTRLPVAPTTLPEDLFDSAASAGVETVTEEPAAIATGAIADRLVELGVPRSLLGATFGDDVAERGTYAALTRALARHLPKAPELPNGAGEVLFLVGPGIETLRTAQTLAASLRLDPDRVQWATRGDLAGLAPESSRVTTVGAAMNRRDDAAVAGTVTIVAVDAPMRADAYWTAQMMAIFNPVAVWAVVEATRKPEDLEPWLARLPQVDAIVVQDTDLSVDPAAVLRRVDAPVALIDGARATPHRWASLLCERLETPQT
ncbi:MAG TPA: hypothetical protein VGN28_13170 [Blastococcus sp.]|nr:hypothetical protein [Blastococcus sp.]